MENILKVKRPKRTYLAHISCYGGESAYIVYQRGNSTIKPAIYGKSPYFGYLIIQKDLPNIVKGWVKDRRHPNAFEVFTECDRKYVDPIFPPLRFYSNKFKAVPVVGIRYEIVENQETGAHEVFDLNTGIYLTYSLHPQFDFNRMNKLIVYNKDQNMPLSAFISTYLENSPDLTLGQKQQIQIATRIAEGGNKK